MEYRELGKRLFDLICSFCGLVILSPLFVVISLLIKMGSSGSIFFIQERMGQGANNFNLIKFRSMYNSPIKEKFGFTPGDGSRITKLGNFLRKTKVDEFPELINVLKGDMSIVGPRPEVPKYRYFYSTKEFGPVLSMRPGITDYASIKYRHEEQILAKSPYPQMMYEKKSFRINCG